MAAEKIHIEQFLELAKQHPVIDVRSPAEYKHAHIPGAHSLPLFSDEERKVVGTTYKQQSREAAIKIGLDYFGPKMRGMVEDAETVCSRQSAVGSPQSTIHSPQSAVDSRQPAVGDPQNNGSDSRFTIHDSRLLVYCWRGGMRSAAVSWLLDMYGFKVYTLTGGYKKFRNYVLDTFKHPFQLKILGGYTGSGKTELLNALKEKGERVVDLEAIAGHKGSAFGNIGLPPQPTQEMFENRLATELRRTLGNRQLAMGNSELAISGDDSRLPSGVSAKEGFTIHDSPLWLEDESQRIGQINIPGELWNTMRVSPVYFLDIPFEERLKHITEEYGRLDKQRVIEAIGRIKEKLGGLNAKNAIQLLEEGNTLESFRVLLEYYDKFYFKALHNREGLNSLLQRIECKSVTLENASHFLLQPKQQPQQV